MRTPGLVVGDRSSPVHEIRRVREALVCRLALSIQGRSRMRQFLTYGSVRGGAQKWASRPQSGHAIMRIPPPLTLEICLEVRSGTCEGHVPALCYA